MTNKEKFEQQNKDIANAILISQMCDTDGYKLFEEWVDELEKSIRFQDIFGIKDKEVLDTQRGIALCLEDVKQYFKHKKLLAMQPMTDPNTGLKEVLNESNAK